MLPQRLQLWKVSPLHLPQTQVTSSPLKTKRHPAKSRAQPNRKWRKSQQVQPENRAASLWRQYRLTHLQYRQQEVSGRRRRERWRWLTRCRKRCEIFRRSVQYFEVKFRSEFKQSQDVTILCRNPKTSSAWNWRRLVTPWRRTQEVSRWRHQRRKLLHHKTPSNSVLVKFYVAFFLNFVHLSCRSQITTTCVHASPSVQKLPFLLHNFFIHHNFSVYFISGS